MKKGDKITISNDSILTIMGHPIATGTVFVLRDGVPSSFKCDQTGSIECIGDGIITLTEAA